MGIFGLLVVELAVTLAVCLPLPRKLRNLIARKVFKLNLQERLSKPILFIGTALGLALIESFFTHQRIIARLREEQEAGVVGIVHHPHTDRFYPGLHDKERKYKSERNMYLAGFALTLLFVLGRITVLLQESVELHDETERLQKEQAGSKKEEDDSLKPSTKPAPDKKGD